MSSIRFVHAGFTFRLFYEKGRDRMLAACASEGQAARAYFLNGGGGWLLSSDGVILDDDGALRPEMQVAAGSLLAENPPCLLPEGERAGVVSELAAVLEAMNVPADRRADWLWLGDNLAGQNANDPRLDRAMALLRTLASHAVAAFIG